MAASTTPVASAAKNRTGQGGIRSRRLSGGEWRCGHASERGAVQDPAEPIGELIAG